MNKIMNLQKQLIVTIDEDEWYKSPRDGWDSLGTFYTWQEGYYSPDRQNFSDGLEFLGSIIGEELIEKIHDKYNNDSDFFDDITKRLDKLGYILYPVSKYDHGLVEYFLGVSSGWDTGTVGVIFAEKKKICEWFNVKKVTQKVRENVIQNFESELDTYTDYANGTGMYSVEIEKFSGDQVESCGGYYEHKHEHETIKQCFNLASELVSDLGDLSDWELYDEDKIDNAFEIKTVTTVTPR